LVALISLSQLLNNPSLCPAHNLVVNNRVAKFLAVSSLAEVLPVVSSRVAASPAEDFQVAVCLVDFPAVVCPVVFPAVVFQAEDSQEASLVADSRVEDSQVEDSQVDGHLEGSRAEDFQVDGRLEGSQEVASL
jgi:hypothetical protein